MAKSKTLYRSKKTKTTEQIPCFLKDGSKREDPTKIRRKDGFCATKKCNSSSILNPETGECISKSSKKGKKLSSNKEIDKLFSDKSLKEIQDNRYKQSKPKRKKTTRPSASIMKKSCRPDQIRNPQTGRCNFVRIPSVTPDTTDNTDVTSIDPSPVIISVPDDITDVTSDLNLIPGDVTPVDNTVTSDEITDIPDNIVTPTGIPSGIINSIPTSILNLIPNVTPKPDDTDVTTEIEITNEEKLEFKKIQEQIEQMFNSILEIRNNLTISRDFSSDIKELKDEIKDIKTIPSSKIDSLKVNIETKLSEIQKQNNKFEKKIETKLKNILSSIEKKLPDIKDKKTVESLKILVEKNTAFISNILSIQNDNKNNNDEMEIKITQFISDMETQNSDKLRVLETFISNSENTLQKIEENNSRLISNVENKLKKADENDSKFISKVEEKLEQIVENNSRLVSNVESKIEKIEENNSRFISIVESKLEKTDSNEENDPENVNIQINNNNNGFGNSLHSLFTLSEQNMINNHLMEEQEVPEIIRSIRFSTN